MSFTTIERTVVPASGTKRLAGYLSRHSMLFASGTYALLLPALWLPVVARTGMAWDTTIIYRSDTTSALNGFLYDGDPLRKFTDVFYQVGYLGGVAVGAKGSWIPFHIVYAILWWARGVLVYAIVARVFPHYRGLAFLLGALAILHASDKQLNLIGQLNQFGMIFWLLLAIYALVRALDATSLLRTAVSVAGAGLASYLCLWSYEAPLVILLITPAILLTVRYGWTRRTVLISGLCLVPPLVYSYDNLTRYASGSGGQYQESILKSPITVAPVARDLWVNIAHSLSFWTWGTGLAGFVRPEGAKPLLLGALEVAILGASTFLFLRVTKAGFATRLRDVAVMGAVGVILLVASFPAYVILVSSTQLYRTQFLSSIGAALVFGSLATAAVVALGPRHRALGWGAAAALCGAIAFFALLGAYSTGSYYNLVWLRQRNVIASVLRAVPRVQPGTVVVLTNVPKNPNPFGDTMWYDFAVRLAYPRVPVAGAYFFGDSTPGIDPSLRLTRGRWVSTGKGFPTLLNDVELRHTVVVRLDGNGGATVQRRLPAFLSRDASDQASYQPGSVVRPGLVSPVARRRYLDS